MADGKKWLYWFLFIVVLLILGAIFKIILIVGVGIFIIGLIIFLHGMENNQEDDAIWGAIIMVAGAVTFFSGIAMYNYFEEMGVTDFLKNIFNTK